MAPLLASTEASDGITALAEEQAMKTYRVWFKDGSAMLVNADSETLARIDAEHLAWNAGRKEDIACKVELLSRGCDCDDSDCETCYPR